MNKRYLFSIPDFSPKEIISYFSDLQIEISLNEILKPTYATTIRIFESVLNVFISPERQIKKSTCNINKNHELGESLHVVDIVQKMSGFLMNIGIVNFTMKDLMADSKRLVQILSTIINFGMYRDGKRHVYEEVTVIAERNEKERVCLENSINALKREIDEAKASLEENTTTKEILEKDIEELERELKKIYKEQKDKASEVGLMKAERTELSDKLSSAQLLEHNLNEEIAYLEAQIVNDPTKLLELVDEMKQLIEKERRGLRLMEDTIKERGDIQGRITRKCEILERIRDVCREINETNEKLEECEHSVILLENKLKNSDSAINAIKIRINHIERQISHLESKLLNLQTKDKKCSEEISQKIGNLRLKYDAVSDERIGMIEKIQANNKLVQDIMANKAKIYSEFEKECSEIISNLIQFSGSIENYFSEINGAF